MSQRIVFMGSPDFAVPVLQGLARKFSVVGVVTQPDKPAGRGRSLTPPPVKTLAQQLGLPFIQPLKVRQPEAMQQLIDWAPDAIVVAAYGQILRQELLNLPPYGCINVHASLLPLWRGAAPIQAAILHGDTQTGVTIMHMDPGIDTGAMYSQRALDILPEDTADSLSRRLAFCGADLLAETLPGILTGQVQAVAQDETQATYAPMLKKEDGLLDFSQRACDLERRVRAFSPWPGAFITWQDQPLKIHKARVDEKTPNTPPGSHLVVRGYPAVATPEGALVLESIQPAGKKTMDGKAFLAGARNWME